MRVSTSIVRILLAASTVSAQDPTDPLLGGFRIGFADTLLFNTATSYSAYGFRGPAPLFVQVWHPTSEVALGEPLTHAQLHERSLPEDLRPVYDTLLRRMDESFISYDLSEQVATYEPITFAGSTVGAVQDMLMVLPTRAHHAHMSAAAAAPAIVYHHGSQGSSDENVVMAEYFASRGYPFVSANFHLPHPDSPYGMEGFTDDHQALRTLIAYARTLTTSDSVVVIGHSWGAQLAWCALNEPGLAEAFVSMETTIEQKTDTAEIKDKWPFVHASFSDPLHQLNIPVLLLACTQFDAPFPYFVGRSSEELLHASAKRPFEHDAYTSAYHLRYMIHDRVPQPDTSLLKEQMELYGEHLRLIDAWITSVRRHEPIALEPFTDTFFLNRTR